MVDLAWETISTTALVEVNSSPLCGKKSCLVLLIVDLKEGCCPALQ
jgi:hypothetical protein